MVGMFILAESLMAVCWVITVFRVLRKMHRSGSPKMVQKCNSASFVTEKEAQLTRHCLELNVGIGKHTASPVSRVRKLAALHRSLLDVVSVQGIAAEEDDDSALKCGVGGNIESPSQVLGSLIKVEDGVTQTRAVKIRFHSIIQRTFFVTEVDSRLKQIANGEEISDIEVVRMLERVYVSNRLDVLLFNQCRCGRRRESKFRRAVCENA